MGLRLRIGEAHLVVTEPTERCRIPGQPSGEPKLLKLLYELDIRRLYATVTAEGRVSTGDAIEITDHSNPDRTINRLDRLMFKGLDDQGTLEIAFTLSGLSETWKTRLAVIRAQHQRAEPLRNNLVEL